MQKAGRKEIEARIDLAYKMMAMGVSKPETIRRLKKDLGVSYSSAHRYTTEAIARMYTDCDIDRKELAVKLYTQLQKILEDSCASKNYNAALGSCNAIANLMLFKNK